jgi:anti-anti-sigma factor
VFHEQSAASTQHGDPESFRCVIGADGDTTVVGPCGELDLATAPELDRALAEIGERGTPVVVDLRGLTFMDSAGVHALTSGAAAAARHGRSFGVVAGVERVQRVLALTGVLDHLVPSTGQQLA